MIKKEFSTNKKYELIDITDAVKKAAKGKRGVVSVFTPHSTAAILITENEPNLKKDWVNFLQSQVEERSFLHDRIDNNAGSHILSGLIGQEKTFPVDGDILTGTWQQIFLVELDGPRTVRKVNIKIIDNRG